jgi:SOS response regulatory protein OraA/RecX
MHTYFLRRSLVDPDFLEVVLENSVIQELKISFAIRRIPPSFATLDEVAAWLKATEYKLVKSYVAYLLARRSYSKASLLQKLKAKKFSSPMCAQVINEFERLGYLSDEEFTEMAIRQKMSQGYGPYYIERYLRGKGLSSHLVRERMTEQNQKESLKKWLLKLRGKDRLKITAFLLRRGFDLSVIQCM